MQIVTPLDRLQHIKREIEDMMCDQKIPESYMKKTKELLADASSALVYASRYKSCNSYLVLIFKLN